MLVKSRLYHWWKRSLAGGLKRRRLNELLRLSGCADMPKLRVLELGCANGKDSFQFMSDSERFTLVGVDIKPQEIDQANVTVIQADAAALPFEDKSFDLVLTIGLLEHIEPMDKLDKVIGEIERVGRACANVVPAVSSPLEPHTLKPFWGVGLHRAFVHKRSDNQILKLNFLSDHSWTKFEGFKNADVCRRWYLPPLVRNTIIYRVAEQAEI